MTADQRARVARRLADELTDESPPPPGGPVIFEIPLEGQDRFDILVVWDAWEPFPSAERSGMILDAYQSRSTPIAQALGVTYREALEQQVLPYAVGPMARRGELDEGAAKKAMLAEGAFTSEAGGVDLRFPTLALAEDARKRLLDTLPKGYWAIIQTA